MKPFALAALFLAAPALAAPAGNTPEKAAHAFYDSYIVMQREGALYGLPDTAHLAKLKPLISAKLFAALQSGIASEARYAKATKGQSPPLEEGDPFTSLFEGARSYYVNSCEAKGAAATCVVALTHREKEVQDVQWRDTLMLVREGGAWKADDISFDAGYAFGNKGTLSGMLSTMDKDSREPVN